MTQTSINGARGGEIESEKRGPSSNGTTNCRHNDSPRRRRVAVQAMLCLAFMYVAAIIFQLALYLIKFTLLPPTYELMFVAKLSAN